MLAPWCGNGQRYRIQGDPIDIAPKAAVTLSSRSTALNNAVRMARCPSLGSVEFELALGSPGRARW